MWQEWMRIYNKIVYGKKTTEQEKEAIQVLNGCKDDLESLCTDCPYAEDVFHTCSGCREKALKTVLQALKDKDNRIKELNKGISSLMQSRKKWKNRYYKLRIINKNISRELITRTDKLTNRRIDMLQDKLKELKANFKTGKYDYKG